MLCFFQTVVASLLHKASHHCIINHIRKSWINNLSIKSFRLIPNPLDTLNIFLKLFFIIHGIKIHEICLEHTHTHTHSLSFLYNKAISTDEVTAEAVAPYERPALTKAFPMGSREVWDIHVVNKKQEIRM